MRRDQYQPLEQKRPMGIYTAMAVIAFLAVALCTGMVVYGIELITRQTDSALGQIAQESCARAEEEMAADWRTLMQAREALKLRGGFDEQGAQFLMDARAESRFAFIGYVDTKGMLWDKNGQTGDVSSLEAVQKALEGEKAMAYIAPEQQAAPGSGLICLLPLQVHEGALMGVLDPSDVLDEDIMERRDMLLITDAGDIVARAGSGTPQEDTLFTYFEKMGCAEEAVSLQDAMRQGESGFFYARFEGLERFVYYQPFRIEPLPEQSFYILFSQNEKLYAKSAENFAALMLLFSAGVFLLLLVLGTMALLIMRRKNNQIARVAYVDEVTGGASTARFERELQWRRSQFPCFSFVVLDIRDFKLINDTFGAKQGDRVLRHVYSCILRCLRTGEFLCRETADVFNIVLLDTDEAVVHQRLLCMADEINAFNKSRQEAYLLPVMCGVCVSGQERETTHADVVTLRDRANSARKRARDGLRPLFTCAFFSRRIQEGKLCEREMENAMDLALERDEFELYLQPKVRIADGQTVGAEALLRWNSKGHGLRQPNTFIPLFERNGFILKLDLYVLKKTCAYLRRQLDAGVEPVPISVNLSRAQLEVPAFWTRLAAVTREYGVCERLIEIELTETVFVEKLSLLREATDRLHELGFACSIDDFGSGYSSLNMLKDVDVDVLKLDKAFFSTPGDARAREVVSAIVGLARSLGVHTVAEGVEDHAAVAFLREIGCDMVQGYVFSRPVPSGEFDARVYPVDGVEKTE